jgi:hypothetical protein
MRRKSDSLPEFSSKKVTVQRISLLAAVCTSTEWTQPDALDFSAHQTLPFVASTVWAVSTRALASVSLEPPSTGTPPAESWIPVGPLEHHPDSVDQPQQLSHIKEEEDHAATQVGPSPFLRFLL